MTSLINTYVEQRKSDEPFIETYRRLGVNPFKEAAYKNALNKNDAKHSKGATA